MVPTVAGVCSAGLVVALLLELAGARSFAVAIAGSSVATALVLPWYIASETAKRNVS
jgi:hypothetical protein